MIGPEYSVLATVRNRATVLAEALLIWCCTRDQAVDGPSVGSVIRWGDSGSTAYVSMRWGYPSTKVLSESKISSQCHVMYHVSKGTGRVYVQLDRIIQLVLEWIMHLDDRGTEWYGQIVLSRTIEYFGPKQCHTLHERTSRISHSFK